MVVAFHAGLPVPGGFVGVDVFFVISGFVITKMLQREWTHTGRIRFGTFYLKRFKRLTPALAVMVAFTMVISAFIMFPFGPQETAAKTGVGALLLSANFVIARTTTGYFAAAAETNPLLNTWSLSVEEQFYIIFPALIALGWALALRRGVLRFSPVFMVGSVTIVSFALSVASATGVTFRESDMLLGFYSPFTRAWEFSVGALLALILTTINARLSNRIMTATGVAGVALLGASLWVITGSTPFPGPWTLMPVTGTLLLLFAGTQRNKISDALSVGPMVRVGDWSYSIYLWHWPFIVFAIYLWPFTPYMAVIAALVSLVPALASYKWIEQPLRVLPTPSRAEVTKLIAITLIPPLILSALLGLTAKFYWQPQYTSGEVSGRYTGDSNAPDIWKYFQDPYFPCDSLDFLYPDILGASDKASKCSQSKPGIPVSVAVVGDSHAAHLFFGLAESLPKKNVAFFMFPLDNPTTGSDGMDSVIESIVDDESIQTVILNGFWSSFNYENLERPLAGTLNSLAAAGKSVFIADDIPFYPFYADTCNHGISPLIPAARCTQSSEHFAQEYATYYPQLQATANQVPGVRLLNTAKYFCDERNCKMTNDSALLYVDDDHLNHQGSKFVIERLLAEYPDFRNAVSAR
jgi:peptidoglycan/LPS O-acetylase OafA/YrhL